MADVNGHSASKGVQAYNWIVAGGIALLGVLLLGVLSTVKDTEKAVGDLREKVSALSGVVDSRFNAHAERLSTHDRRFDRLEDRLSPGAPSFRSPN